MDGSGTGSRRAHCLLPHLTAPPQALHSQRTAEPPASAFCASVPSDSRDQPPQRRDTHPDAKFSPAPPHVHAEADGHTVQHGCQEAGLAHSLIHNLCGNQPQGLPLDFWPPGHQSMCLVRGMPAGVAYSSTRLQKKKPVRPEGQGVRVCDSQGLFPLLIEGGS